MKQLLWGKKIHIWKIKWNCSSFRFKSFKYEWCQIHIHTQTSSFALSPLFLFQCTHNPWIISWSTVDSFKFQIRFTFYLNAYFLSFFSLFLPLSLSLSHLILSLSLSSSSHSLDENDKKKNVMNIQRTNV